MLTQRCYGHITLGLCRHLGEVLISEVNSNSKTPLKIQFWKNLWAEISRNPDPDFETGLHIIRGPRFLKFLLIKEYIEIRSQTILGIYERILILRGSRDSASMNFNIL